MIQKTVQEIIYSAWKNTEKPIVYVSKNAKGEQEKKELDFLNPETNKDYDPDAGGECNLCGEKVEGGVPIKKALSASYMDWNIHKNPEGTHLCKACAFCIGLNPVGRITIMRYPLVATEEKLYLCSRSDFRNWLINPPEPPFVMILPTLGKKHLFSKSKVSYSRDRYFCNLEERPIEITGEIEGLIESIEALRGVGFTKIDIASERVPGNVIKKYGYGVAELFIKTIRKINRNSMVEIAMEVAQKMEETRAECYLDLEQII